MFFILDEAKKPDIIYDANLDRSYRFIEVLKPRELRSSHTLSDDSFSSESSNEDASENSEDEEPIDVRSSMVNQFISVVDGLQDNFEPRWTDSVLGSNNWNHLDLNFNISTTADPDVDGNV